MSSMKILLRYLVIVLLFSLLSLESSLVLGETSSIVATIGSDGVVEVFMNITLPQGIQEIKAPIPPIPASIIARRDSEILPVIYDRGSIILILDRVSLVSISYIANVSIENGVFRLGIDTNDTIILIVPLYSIVILTLPESILNYSIYNNTLYLSIRGPQVIEYTLRTPSPPSVQTTTSPPLYITITTSSPQTMPPSPPLLSSTPTQAPPLLVGSIQNLLILVAVLVVIIVIGVIIARRRFF
ncbi:MAG: hypothetical protein ABWJ42_06665 [Sulfolobales archaeon]